MILGVVTAVMFGTSAHAADPVAPLILIAYGNETEGRALAGGDHDAAARILSETHSGSSTDAVVLDTNRCVAYSMLQQFSAARAACGSAIRDVEQERLAFWALGSLPAT